MAFPFCLSLNYCRNGVLLLKYISKEYFLTFAFMLLSPTQPPGNLIFVNECKTEMDVKGNQWWIASVPINLTELVYSRTEIVCIMSRYLLLIFLKVTSYHVWFIFVALSECIYFLPASSDTSAVVWQRTFMFLYKPHIERSFLKKKKHTAGNLTTIN